MTSPPVLDRVRKLLALAGSPNVHEAAAAAAAAQTLIERHRLQALLDAVADDAANPVTDGRAAPLDTARKLRPWRVALAAGLARANGGVAYTAAVGDREVLLVAGRAPDRAAVAALFEALAKRIEWLSATHGAGRPRSWHEAFRVGAAETVVARLAAGSGEATAGFDDATQAQLAPARAAHDVAVEDFVSARLQLRPGRGLCVDARGFARGRVEGAGMVLPQAFSKTA